MNNQDFKNLLLNTYHKDINYWWRLLGEMCDGTNEFTTSYSINCVLGKNRVKVIWDVDKKWMIGA